MKKTTLALVMHDKLFKRARTMYRIEHQMCIRDSLVDGGKRIILLEDSFNLLSYKGYLEREDTR